MWFLFTFSSSAGAGSTRGSHWGNSHKKITDGEENRTCGALKQRQPFSIGPASTSVPKVCSLIGTIKACITNGLKVTSPCAVTSAPVPTAEVAQIPQIPLLVRGYSSSDLRESTRLLQRLPGVLLAGLRADSVLLCRAILSQPIPPPKE